MVVEHHEPLTGFFNPGRYAMRSVNFSNDNLAVQWQYVKRNLGEFGISYQFDDFEIQAQGIVQKLIHKQPYKRYRDISSLINKLEKHKEKIDGN